ncbi:MAG: hypothetical protein GY832_26115 [Chloroflexi bacterium]|nr:hypothetical protein [Chloroflexota bacterium]
MNKQELFDGLIGTGGGNYDLDGVGEIIRALLESGSPENLYYALEIVHANGAVEATAYAKSRADSAHQTALQLRHAMLRMATGRGEQ